MRVLRKPQFHRDTIHGDVSCRRRDHIALADVRCVVTAGLDGIASLRLLCLLRILNTVERLAIFILTDLVQWYNSQMQTTSHRRCEFDSHRMHFFFFFVWLPCAVHVLCHGRPQRRRGHAPQP